MELSAIGGIRECDFDKLNCTWGMRRDDICLYYGPDDRAELRALVKDRNTPRKLVWRDEIVLAAGPDLKTDRLAVAGAVSR